MPIPPRSSYDVQRTDYLVIGSGIAGLRAALELARDGEVLILNKGMDRESNSAYAQGGIAAAINPFDSAKSHYEDTLKAGKGLCKASAVKILVEEGILRVRELIEWGTHFDRKGNALLFTQEAAHSRQRILRAGGDATGDEIIKSLLLRVRSEPNIQLLDHHFSVDLYVEGGVCKGAWVLLEEEEIPKIILSKSVILATGGAGQIYLRTTNPSIATGDGMAIGYRQGAIVQDMEFVQFHPTALCLPGAAPFLLSEAMRGEGGRLRNVKGEAFMKRYYPEAELAPRDLVSRAIWEEMEKTRANHVYLDMTGLPPTVLKKRFPTIYKTCLSYGIDFTRDLIPTSPSAHFMMGGIQTDLRGRTPIKGLYAAGEVACTGVHGANRLASNSLLEGIVFGTKAGQQILKTSKIGKEIKINQKGLDRQFKVLLKPPPLNPKALNRLRLSCKKILWENVGIVRNEKGLSKACTVLKKWNRQLPFSCFHRETMEVKNMLTVSLLVAKAAYGRKESLGAHFRSDYPFSSSRKTHSFLKK
ncbi:MAG: L-aspartate oxidase [Nitrospirae bacterium]|nr:L-aspartate oxidase [Nitrospirota bacterium]MBI3352845.1 L-aspartate oxidase [Nitrospirota bacterium]